MFAKERIIKSLLIAVAMIIPMSFIIILFHVTYESIPAITQIGTGLFDAEGAWRPLSATPSFSILPMILATLYIAFLSVLMAAPVACLCAIFLNYCIDKKIAKPALAFIDLLAGVPSVIFGFLGLIIVISNFERIFNMSAGESILAASVVLAVMVLPFIVSSYSESIEKAKEKYGVAALSLGTSTEYSVIKIIIPTTKRGAFASIVTAFARAMSETMAVMMVIGNAPIFPRLFGRAQTIPALTALEFGNAEYGSLHLSAIYAANLTLIVLIACVLIGSHLLRKGLLKDDDNV